VPKRPNGEAPDRRMSAHILVELAHAAGHVADHVNYRGLGSSKDWQLMAVIREQDYTFVTNNRSDFLTLHGHNHCSRSDHHRSRCHS